MSAQLSLFAAPSPAVSASAVNSAVAAPVVVLPDHAAASAHDGGGDRCDPGATAPQAPRESARARGPEHCADRPPAVAPLTLVTAGRPPPTAVPPAPSRTRLLIDAIQRELPGARVVLTDNRSVLLSQQERDGLRVVRVHQMFLDAPDDVRVATARFLRTGRRHEGAVVDAFIASQHHLLRLHARPLPDNAHRGRTHDLLPLYVALNAEYFGRRIDAEVGWGQAGSPQRRRRRSITFGSYDHRARRIVMHPCLDQAHVPVHVVARVLHHEMLHQDLGEGRDAHGRRVIHSARFRALEAEFRDAALADAWLDANLDGLLRFRLHKAPESSR